MKMDYQIMEMKQKTLVGLKARTGNSDPKMGAAIGGLWQRLFGEELFTAIESKVNQHSIGLYSDYDSGRGEYDITVGCEVSRAEHIPADTVIKLIPEGRYAKFVIFGDMVQAVCDAWNEIWKMDLERTFTGDYEEYVSTQEEGECEIHIYVAVK